MNLKPALLTISVASGLCLLPLMSQQSSSPSRPADQMNMGDMMKGCREHCQRTIGSIGNLERTITDARQSNDVGKMRSALDQAQKPLAEMRDHMNMCMKMMDMMGGMMQGKSGRNEKEPSKKK